MNWVWNDGGDRLQVWDGVDGDGSGSVMWWWMVRRWWMVVVELELGV